MTDTAKKIAQNRRFIEVSFPVKEVGEASAKEKNIRHGHISTLHIWWARRPLAASRATAYAALIPEPQDAEEWQRQRDFIVQLCQWENSNNAILLERARREILQANGGIPPKVLDPFSGGGSYPLEALRLGCESYANDYNPVAVLIEKATLEYPQKFGKPFENMPEWAKNPETGKQGNKKTGSKKEASQVSFFDTLDEITNPLLNAVRYWGEWVLEEARKELAEFYPPDPDGSVPVGYIGARTIPCQNPACGVEIPLMRQFWLAKKDKKQIALHPITHGAGKPIEFEIVARGTQTEGSDYAEWHKNFNPDDGTVRRAIVTCPACGAVIDDKTTRRLFQAGNASQRMVAVVLSPLPRGEGTGVRGKTYRLPTAADQHTYRAAQQALQHKIETLRPQWGIEPVPDEPTPEGKGSGAERAFSVQNYGMYTWGDLFNPRQQLALLTFADAVRRAHQTMLNNLVAHDFAQAIGVYLALALDMVAAFTNSLARWENTSEIIKQLFGRQALQMLWDYAEVNPLNNSSGGFETGQTYYLKVLFHLSEISSQYPHIKSPILYRTNRN